MAERIQKILSARGVASRRKAEELISAGRVTCNGKTAVLGDTADGDTDRILVDGKEIPGPQKNVYLMLHKPRGYVTTLSDEKGRRDVSELISGCPVRVYPVGRLDMDSEGLLLLTNDGALAEYLMHPHHEVNKVYEAWVQNFSPEKAEKLRQPIILDGYQIRPPKVTVLKPGFLQITIHEGRNRQVRRMCQAAGMAVTRLRRVREGPLALGNLEKGKWRYLSEEEIQILLAAKSRK